MTHTTSIYMGNTAYYSDCQLFSSLSKEAVLEFEASGIKSKFDLNRSDALKWSFSGSCKIAEDYLLDWSRANVNRTALLKDLKRGNWCPIKVSRKAFNQYKEYLENLGYTVGNEYR